MSDWSRYKKFHSHRFILNSFTVSNMALPLLPGNVFDKNVSFISTHIYIWAYNSDMWSCLAGIFQSDEWQTCISIHVYRVILYTYASREPFIIRDGFTLVTYIYKRVIYIHVIHLAETLEAYIYVGLYSAAWMYGTACTCIHASFSISSCMQPLCRSYIVRL